MDLKICIKKEKAPLFTDRKCKYYELIYYRIPIEYHKEIDDKLEKCYHLVNVYEINQCKNTLILSSIVGKYSPTVFLQVFLYGCFLESSLLKIL